MSARQATASKNWPCIWLKEIGHPAFTSMWFPDGFHGTMGELLCAIEEKRPSLLDARDNLESLALCFAAVESADTGLPIRPGAVRKLPT
ncbi:MAG: hypothetical protein U0892_03765 [Pirellulales bacterium]